MTEKTTIVKMLELSTAQITEATYHRLLNHTTDKAMRKLYIKVYENNGYGFLIVITDDPDNPTYTTPNPLNDLPNDLSQVLKYAWENGYELIMLDKANVIIDELPSYDR